MKELSKHEDINVFLISSGLSSDVIFSEINIICKDFYLGMPLAKIPYFYKTYRKKIAQYVKQWDIDVIQAYSEPDDFAVSAIESHPCPVVFCNRDNVSAYSKELLATRIVPHRIAYHPVFGYVPRKILYNYIYNLEKKAHEQSDANIYISPGMLDYSCKHFNIGLKPNFVMSSWVAEDEIPKSPLKKLSQQDGKIHIGFTGAIVIHDNYRNHLPFLNKLATGDINVHMHVVCHDESSKKQCVKVSNTNPNLHLHMDLLPPNNFITLMTRYDWGLIPFECEWTYVDTLLTNKIYDYISAQIPIITSPAKTLTKFITDRNIGFVYKDLAELHDLLCTKNPSDYVVNPNDFLLKNDIPYLVENVYKKVLK